MAEKIMNQESGSKYQDHGTEYANCMKEIKQRMEFIRDVINLTHDKVYFPPAVESIALQIRQILELIMFAALAANHHRFEGDGKVFKKGFREVWNAKEISEKIEKRNPGFYPYPCMEIPVIGGKGYRYESMKTGFLTREEFIVLYDKCNKMVHARNPFSKEDRKFDEFHDEFPGWMEKIHNLLCRHTVVIRIGDESVVDVKFHVRMKSNEGGAVEVTEAHRIPVVESENGGEPGE